MWSFLKPMAEQIGTFVCYEPEHFFTARPSCRVCVRIDITKDRPNEIEIVIGNESFMQKVQYIGLPDTCFHCQSSLHKIKDCPLMVSQYKEKTPLSMEKPATPTQNPSKGEEEWKTVPNCRNR